MLTSKILTPHFKKVAITSGDPGGIGIEVICKSLHKLGPQRNTIFFLYRDHQQAKKQPQYFKLLDENFLRLTFTDQDAAFGFVNSLQAKKKIPKNILVDLSLKSSAAQWILDAGQACLDRQLTSLVTGPVSKTLIKKAGFSFMGHTGAFRQLCPKTKMHMAFIGKKFNVLLASDHLPLEKIPGFLNKKTLSEAFVSARLLKKLIGSSKKMAVLGLNPHAGEEGLLGSFEKKYLSSLTKDLVGPLVPDAAFLKPNWGKYACFVCLYHDQGLIPFKAIHGQDSGVHITIGLPFLRTSVDHGTAFDIYNKNLANPASMLDAIRLNLKLTRG